MQRHHFLFAILSLLSNVQFTFSQNTPGQQQVESEKMLNWTIPATPTALSFAGEKVPLERWDVREQFEREWLHIYYQQNSNLHILRLASRYFPLIEERLKANGVPDDFKYLCIAESHLQNLISKAGAVGFWQFMPGTSPGYGIKVNTQADERYNVLKSTNAACAYLKAAYSRFGSWTAAAASYNCGQAGYNNYARAQLTYNYYELYLPEETNKYIYRILSYKYLVEHASELGYNVGPSQFYQPLNLKTITISQSVRSWIQFAKEHGTSYKVLRLLNPWIRSYSLAVREGETYRIYIPQ